ncbi:MAG: hypothetical protein LBK83_05700 [Treponema sp.]|jgi:hypothetical protein|nr:hypothetical protein [Treponema sp.]
MKKGLYVTMIAGIAATLLIGGCEFLLGPDEVVGGGNLAIDFGESGNRGAAPADLERYDMVLTGPREQKIEARVSAGENFYQQVALGEWHIDAKAYNAGNVLIGTGSITVTVKPGRNEVRIPMRRVPVPDTPPEDPTYTITIGTFSGGAVSASPASATAGTSITLTVTPDTNYILQSGSLKYNGTAITGGPPYTFTMPASDISVEAVFELSYIVTNSTEFAAALSAIQGAGANLRFPIIATADISLAPQDLSLAAYADKTVVLTGNDPARTLSLSSEGSLFTVGADVALELENIVLQGISANTAPLITVTADGKLAVKTGGKITGNTYTITTGDTGGAGVFVSSGELEIAGGEINTNIVTSSGSITNALGGGILVDNGSVVMTGGAIRGNTITSIHTGDGNSQGGGIYIRNGSSFEMSAGKIEGNSINSQSTNQGDAVAGVGVCILNSVFRLSGGLIRNNTASNYADSLWSESYGGGVYIISDSLPSTFVMEGGIISGNSLTSNVSPNYISGSIYSLGVYGAGVGLQERSGGSCTMTKTGGIIYGNDVTGNDTDGYPLKNEILSDGNITSGHAVYLEVNASTTKYWRSATAYEPDHMDRSIPGNPGGWE